MLILQFAALHEVAKPARQKAWVFSLIESCLVAVSNLFKKLFISFNPEICNPYLIKCCHKDHFLMPSWAGDEVLKQRSIYIKKKKCAVVDQEK